MNKLNIVVVIVSDTRTDDTDKSGKKLKQLIENDGHAVLDKIIVKDKIKDKNHGKLTRAPRTSKRHVSSSDSFHKEDFIYKNFYSDQKNTSDTEKEIITKYLLIEEQ